MDSKEMKDFKDHFDSEINRLDQRFEKLNNRTWLILLSILGGFGVLLVSLLSLIVPVLNQLLKVS